MWNIGSSHCLSKVPHDDRKCFFFSFLVEIYIGMHPSPVHMWNADRTRGVAVSLPFIHRSPIFTFRNTNRLLVSCSVRCGCVCCIVVELIMEMHSVFNGVFTTLFISMVDVILMVSMNAFSTTASDHSIPFTSSYSHAYFHSHHTHSTQTSPFPSFPFHSHPFSHPFSHLPV